MKLRRTMMSNLLTLSSTMLYTAFAFYSFATIMFGVTLTDKNKQKKIRISEMLSLSLTIIVHISQLYYFVTCWISARHAYVSKMFVFMTSLCIGIFIAFIIIYFIYRLYILGLFALPVALILIAYASMFPTEFSPLQPSLQSPWLYIHITTVALSQGILGISFVAGLIYLIKQIDQNKRNKGNMWL